ncbi:MAG: hypothetical protein A2776_01905 [Candidatus Levybacteria bacterium RIFCSPHIGHO2_01_FULL_40_10]|nr:MAG: hypothetical protein A2776_01905 [Candidatus Levybacteria bacterium RIFCSPHIGHO2_01_FULL_40_10]
MADYREISTHRVRGAELDLPNIDSLDPETLLLPLEGWTYEEEKDLQGQPMYHYKSPEEGIDSKLGLIIAKRGVKFGLEHDLGLLSRVDTGRVTMEGDVRIGIGQSEIEFNTAWARYRFVPRRRFATSEHWDPQGHRTFGVVRLGK